MAQKKVPTLTDDNPLADLLTDKKFEELQKRGLLSKIGVRNHYMKNLFAQERAKGRDVNEAIEEVRCRFPYLLFDSIKKIVSGKW